MNILITTLFYTPDIGPSAPLFSLLCESLVKRGHEVSIIAAVPHYATGKVQPQFRKKWINETCEGGVHVIRVRVPSLNRSNFALRLLQFVSFQIGATIASMNRKFDVAIITNPALECLLPFFWQKTFNRKPIIFSIHDIYPDVGIKLGIFKSKFVIGFISKIEQYCMTNATIIRILSNSFRPGVKKLDISDSKLVLIYDWVDTNLIYPLPKNNTFSREHHLEDKFVVLYAGNIGLSQGLENIMAVAEKLKDYDKLRFVLVGNGAGLQVLQSQVEERKIFNVQFISFQPRERLPEVLASADVSLVILKRGIGADSLPSKTFSALASGRPVLASVDVDSETWRLINQAKAGICVPPEDPDQLGEAILKLMADKDLRKQLGNNGRIWAEKNHSVQSATEKFEKLFAEAIKAGIS